MYKAMNNTSGSEDYFNFKESVIDVAGIASVEDFRTLIRCLTVSLGNFQRTNIDMHREMFEINNLMLENNIFLENNGFLTELHFNKYVSYCCTCREIAAAEKFLSNYSGKLPADTKQNCLNFAMAEINFAKGSFRKSLEYLAKANDLYFEMKFSIRTLEIMNHYELGDFEAFLYALDSSKHLAKYNKPLELEKIRNFTEFYNIVSTLFQYKNNKKSADAASLRKSVENSYPYRKKWLLEKIEELLRVDS
jgi:hypothetical protein